MSSSNLIDLMTLTWNLPLNFDVAFCNWLDKFLPPTIRNSYKHIACDDYAFRIICTQRHTNTCKNSHEHADNLKSFFGCQTN